MASRVYVEILTVNGVSVYSGSGSPNGSLQAARGSLYARSDTAQLWQNTDGSTSWVQVGSGGGGGSRWQITWQAGGVDNPTTGVYAAFSDAHSACAAIRALGLEVDMIWDNSLGTLTVPGGTFNMDGIAPIGISYLEASSSLTGFTPAQSSSGTVFTNFNLGFRFIDFLHNGTDPLCTYSDSGTNQVYVGDNSRVRTSADYVFYVLGTYALLQSGARFQFGDVESGLPVVGMDASGIIDIYVGNGSTLGSDKVQGAGILAVYQASSSSVVYGQTLVTGNFSFNPAIYAPFAYSVTIRPNTDQPGLGVYPSFERAWTAARNLSTVLPVRILLDAPTSSIASPVVINTPGTYDMSNIFLEGVPYPQLGTGNIPRHVLSTAIGVFFSNFVNGTPGIYFWHRGSSSLCSLSLSATRRILSSGGDAIWRADSAAILEFFGGGVGTLRMNLGFRALLSLGYEVIDISQSGTSLRLEVDSATIDSGTIRGVVGSVLQYKTLSGLFITSQPNFLGTIQTESTALQQPFVPTNASDWLSSPSTAQEAFDELAAKTQADSLSVVGDVLPSPGLPALLYSGICTNGISVEFDFNISVTVLGFQIEQVTEGTAIGQKAYVHYPSSSFASRNGSPLFVDVFSFTKTNVRLFSGFVDSSGSTILDSASPAFQYMGLQFDTGRGDVNFQIATRGSGGVQVLTDTGIAPVDGTIYRYVIDVTATRAIHSIYFVSDGSGVQNILLYQLTYSTVANYPSSFTWFSGVASIATDQVGINRTKLAVATTRFIPS